MSQRDYMRLLYKQYGSSESMIIDSYTEAEQKGLVLRRSNERRLDSSQYAKALYKDGIRKGWIIEH